MDYVKNGGTLVVQYNVAEGGNPFGGNTICWRTSDPIR